MQRRAQQIVGRERRGRVSQLAWCGKEFFDSRRRVNSLRRHTHSKEDQWQRRSKHTEIES